MSSESIRSERLSFLGQSKFITFALQIRSDTAHPRIRGKRVRFWQDELLEKFANDRDIVFDSLELLRTVALWCPIHVTSLKNCKTPTIFSRKLRGRMGQTALEYRKQLAMAAKCQFPFGYGGFLLNCDTCCKACSDWLEMNPMPGSRG